MLCEQCIARNILLGLVVPVYILISCHNKMLEFRKPRVSQAPATDDQRERKRLQPRSDFCLNGTNIPQHYGFRNLDNVIFVRETSDPAMVNSVSKNQKMKMRKSTDLLPVIVE